MPQVCRVCIHPNRDAIDAELARDWERGLRGIGEEYGLSKDSLSRHAQNHLPTATGSAEFGQKEIAGISEQKKAAVAVLNNQNKSNRPTATTSLDLAQKEVAEIRQAEAIAINCAEKDDEARQVEPITPHEKSNPWANWERE